MSKPLEAEDLVSALDLEDEDQKVRVMGPALKREITADYVRDLTEADMAAFAVLPRGRQPASLVRIHASHHSLARCLASGLRPSQAGLVTGYSVNRINALQSDPAFQALVADYNAEAKSVFADLAERMSDLSLDAIEILQERLQESPETFTVPVLLDLVKAFADRTGHGPNSEVSLRLSADLIDRPPREDFDAWKARRDKELAPEPEVGPKAGPLAPKRLN